MKYMKTSVCSYSIVDQRKGFLRMKRLSEVAEIRTGFAFRSRLDHDPAGPISVIQMRDLEDSGGINLGGAVRIDESSAMRAQLLHPGDLLFRSRGETFRAVGVPEGIMPSVLAAPMLRIRPLHVDSGYLLWFINSERAQAELHAFAEGTAVRMISKQQLGRLVVPVPAIERQACIAKTAVLEAQERRLMTEIADLRSRLINAALASAAGGIH